jgi:ferredoxin--NADP+ reductase/benzoate/toluate 1,2-dioxygenase reductase subunit
MYKIQFLKDLKQNRIKHDFLSSTLFIIGCYLDIIYTRQSKVSGLIRFILQKLRWCMVQQHKHKKSKHSLLRTVNNMNFDLASVEVDKQFKVQQIRDLTESTYVVRFDRCDMEFIAGQHITLGIPGDNQVREYSIYSTIHDPFVEVLIKEVEDGLVSCRIHALAVGDLLNVDGPFGFFTIDTEELYTRKFLFVATGTGIAPFHSIAGSYPELNYRILHGVRYASEGYERSFYPEDRYILCTSRDQEGDFNGRVTDYMSVNEIDSDTLIYLCGNCDMIYEVYDLLTSRGIDTDQIKTEVYF